MNIKAGFGKQEIQIPEFNIGMMGYGHEKNIAKTQATPLYARSLILNHSHEDKILYMVFNVVEICFISMAMKDAVIQDLKKLLPMCLWNYDNIVLSHNIRIPLLEVTLTSLSGILLFQDFDLKPSMLSNVQLSLAF
jgi:hypothetical protein